MAKPILPVPCCTWLFYMSNLFHMKKAEIALELGHCIIQSDGFGEK